MIGPGLGAILAAVGVAIALVVIGRRRDAERRRAFEQLGHASGLILLERDDPARAPLGRLPGLPGPGRVVFGPVLLGADECIADVRVVTSPKERRRDRWSTLVARRREGRGAPPSRREHEDPSPSGFGRVVLASDSGWTLCRSLGGRVPAERLPAFVEHARQLVASESD